VKPLAEFTGEGVWGWLKNYPTNKHPATHLAVTSSTPPPPWAATAPPQLTAIPTATQLRPAQFPAHPDAAER